VSQTNSNQTQLTLSGYSKARRVIKSCQTVAQLVSATSYIRLLDKAHPKMPVALKESLALVFSQRKSYIKRRMFIYGNLETQKEKSISK
jgi:hypothetical protein